MRKKTTIWRLSKLGIVGSAMMKFVANVEMMLNGHDEMRLPMRCHLIQSVASAY